MCELRCACALCARRACIALFNKQLRKKLAYSLSTASKHTTATTKTLALFGFLSVLNRCTQSQVPAAAVVVVAVVAQGHFDIESAMIRLPQTLPHSQFTKQKKRFPSSGTANCCEANPRRQRCEAITRVRFPPSKRCRTVPLDSQRFRSKRDRPDGEGLREQEIAGCARRFEGEKQSIHHHSSHSVG